MNFTLCLNVYHTVTCGEVKVGPVVHSF